MNVPDWAVEILKSSPTLAVCLLVVWYAFRHITRQHEQHLKTLREAYTKHLASKEAEIQRLEADKTALLKKIPQERK